MHLNDVPARVVRTVENRSAPELHMPDGRVEAALLHPYTDTMGRRRGDVYLRYTPNPPIIDIERVSNARSETPDQQ